LSDVFCPDSKSEVGDCAVSHRNWLALDTAAVPEKSPIKTALLNAPVPVRVNHFKSTTTGPVTKASIVMALLAEGDVKFPVKT
jgi:hypothetical protein